MSIANILVYFCTKYPLPHELSKARLTKMVYLADWESCLRSGKQLTNIQWYFHNFGPYVEDVLIAAEQCSELDVVRTENIYGDAKQVIKARPRAATPEFSRDVANILDDVMNKTKGLYWSDFIRYVYATKPIAQSTRYTVLNLERFARSEPPHRV
jgi:hypothetical protein